MLMAFRASRGGGLLLSVCVSVGACLLAGGVSTSPAQDKQPGTKTAAKPAGSARDTSRGDKMLADYFRTETAAVAKATLADIKTLEDWTSRRAETHRQLREMLGLDPWPEKTPLQPVITGKVDHEQFVVEKVQFQSRPGLYVTGNLYVPKNIEKDKKLPAILYVCGHGRVIKDGVSLGNKTHYQHHGGWFARNGYVCLTIDTLQLGEIQGLHHGTNNLKMWWWNSRGYTPAGVEAWNCVRALDYLQSRAEVDPERLGVTGRSGGGAYSWWIAALDERIKVAVPVAGITDLENHVVDHCVEGHCDCMYMVNTYRWDYAKVAALGAPRALLISNTDKDPIFPLEGVVRVHDSVRKIYKLYGAGSKLGLQITEGPHLDTQELHIHAFRWFNRHLKNDTTSHVSITAVPLFEKDQLKVFQTLPGDERNTRIQEEFTVTAPAPATPASAQEWAQARQKTLDLLRAKVFQGWPDEKQADAKSLDVQEVFAVEKHGIRFTAYDFTSQHDIRLRLYFAHRAGLKPHELELVVLNAHDDAGWNKFLATYQTGFAEELRDEVLPGENAETFEQDKKMFQTFKWGMAYLAPRGVGMTTWNLNERKQTHIRRRFNLLGQTLDGMRVWDVRRAVQTLRTRPELVKTPLWLQGEQDMAGVVLYASLFEPNIARLDLWSLPTTHRDGVELLNVLRVHDLPHAVALAAEKTKVILYHPSDVNWEYPKAVAEKLGWDKKQIQVRKVPAK